MSHPLISANEQMSAEIEFQTEKAYELWHSRQDRLSHPAGIFDSQRRWYPAADERRSCCSAIRSPSAAYPNSLNTHCRSIEHVANLHSVSAYALRSRLAQDRQLAKREGGDSYYKAVAVRDGRFYSIFDGTTEYRVGETVADRARQHHEGGIYVYGTEKEARQAQVPQSSELLDAPRVVMRVRAEGAYCRYDNGKLAFSFITPLAVCR